MRMFFNSKRVTPTNAVRVVASILLVLTTTIYAQPKARNYQDCLLQATAKRSFDSLRDIGHIKQECEAAFPESAPRVLGYKLNNDSMDKLDIYTHADNDSNIVGTVFNGNPDLFITRLQILITPKKGDPVQDFFDSEEFEINLKIPPSKTETFKISAEELTVRGDYSWKLIRAWGY